MGRYFNPLSIRNLRILDLFGRSKSEAQIARILGLKGSASVSRTKDCMLDFRDPISGYPTPLLEEVAYSSGKFFRLTQKGTELLLQNIKVLETQEIREPRNQNVKPSQNVKINDKEAQNTASAFHHGKELERRGGQNVKPSRYESQTWRLHARKRVFELANTLDDSDLATIYHGFSKRYRVVLNGKNRPEGKRLKGASQLTGDYKDRWEDGDVAYLKVSFRIIASRNPKFILYGPQVERPFGYGNVHDLEELHEEQVEEILPQIEQDIRSFLPKFRIKRFGNAHEFTVGTTKDVGELALTEDGFSKRSPESVHIIKNSQNEDAISMDMSKDVPEAEGIHKTEAVNYMEKIDDLLRAVIEDRFSYKETNKLAVISLSMLKELTVAQKMSQDQQDQLREDVRSLYKFIQPGGYR